MAGMLAVWFWMLPYSLELDAVEDPVPLVNEIDTSINDIRAQLDQAGAVLGETTSPQAEVEVNNPVAEDEIYLTPAQLDLIKQQLEQTVETNEN